jgi:hypothetical protein
MSAVPYTGARAFARLAARTTAMRVLLGAVLAVLILAVAATARHPKLDKAPLVASRAGGVLVLDLSASISSDTFSRIGTTLADLSSRGGRYGLVVFSTSAYEALPPGTPASALAPLVRYFQLPRQTPPGQQATYPLNPWTKSFSAGTQIALGLELARRVELDRHTRHPAVVLISDLADDPSDLSRLTAELEAYKANGIKLTVIPLDAAPADLGRFAGVATRVLPASTSAERPTAGKPPRALLPIVLIVLIVVIAALLATNELRSARLRWGVGSR